MKTTLSAIPHISIIVVIFAFVVLHVLGMISLYANISWYDALLHGLGGAWIAHTTWLLSRQPGTIKFRGALFILGMVALVGVSWEFLEFIYDKIAMSRSWELPLLQQSLSDTLSDLLMDILGGIATTIILASVSKNKGGMN